MESLLKNRGTAIVVLAVVLLAYAVHVFFWWPQINDDAFITFRYSWFLANGAGPVFNPGERVEGYSNFLLMLLIAAAIPLLGDESVLTVAKVVGLVGGAAAIVAAWGLCRGLLRQLPALAPYAGSLAGAAALLIAADCCFALNSTTGLETTLYAALIIAALWAQFVALQRGRWLGAGVLFALAALTRPEGVTVFVAAALGQVVAGEWRRPGGLRRLILDGLCFGLLVGAHLAFRVYYYDGEWVPNTYWAKAGGFDWRMSSFEYVWLFIVNNLVVALAVVAAACLMPPTRRAALPALAVAVVSLIAVVRMGSDWMPGARLLVPYLPVWAALAVCGICVCMLHFRVNLTSSVVALAVTVVGVFLWQSTLRKDLYHNMLVRAAGYDTGHGRLARWLSSNAAPGDTVALMDIGLIGYLNPQLRILDISGLTDRTIAKSPGGFLEKQYDPAYVLDQKPRFMVMAVNVPRGETMPDFERALCWTDMEVRLASLGEFLRYYLRQREPREGEDQLQTIAAIWGAEAVFEHLYPGPEHYFLAIYERRDSAKTPMQVLLDLQRSGGFCPICRGRPGQHIPHKPME